MLASNTVTLPPQTSTGERPLRVLMVTARYRPLTGGTETHVYEVAQRLARRGVDITVCTTDTTGTLPATENQNGVKVERVRAWPADHDFYFAPAIYRTIARGQWDIVHCQSYHTLVAPLTMLAAQKARIPYVVTFHSGGHSSSVRTRARQTQQRVLRPLLAGAARLVAVSQFEVEYFSEQLNIPREQFVVIPNGAEMPQVTTTPNSDPDAPLIVSIGRLEAYKGHHRVLAAFPHILARRPGAHLRIVGSGPYEATLQQMAHDLGIAEHVEIGAIPPSDRNGMADVLGRASLVMLLSDYEAHPVAVMEALAVGRPVLVAFGSGLQELVDRGLVRGIHVESTAITVANAVIEQLDQPHVPPTIELPTWDGCAADLLALYRTYARQPLHVS